MNIIMKFSFKLELYLFSKWNIVFYSYSLFACWLFFLEADCQVSHIINDVIKLRNDQIKLLDELVWFRKFSKLDCFD